MVDSELVDFDDALEADEVRISLGELEAILDRMHKRADSADAPQYSAAMKDAAWVMHQAILLQSDPIDE